MMLSSCLNCVLILAVLLILSTFTSGISADPGAHFLMGRKVTSESGRVSATNSNSAGVVEMSQRDLSSFQEDSSTLPVKANISQRVQSPNEYHGTRGSSIQRRRTTDVEDILNDMATRDPAEWTAVEWFIMILFLSFIGWLGCCMCTLCCCGGGGAGSDLLRCLCLYEICCRGGSDIDACCDYGLA